MPCPHSNTRILQLEREEFVLSVILNTLNNNVISSS